MIWRALTCYNMLVYLDGLEHVLTCVVFVLEHGSLFQLLSKAWYKMNWRWFQQRCKKMKNFVTDILILTERYILTMLKHVHNMFARANMCFAVCRILVNRVQRCYTSWWTGTCRQGRLFTQRTRFWNWLSKDSAFKSTCWKPFQRKMVSVAW